MQFKAYGLFLSFSLLTMLFSAVYADEIRCSSEAGKKVYYNIPSVHVESEAADRSSQSLYPQRVHTYDAIIEDIAGRHGMDAALVKAVIHVESAYNSKAVSPAGARGLMQLMPATANRFGVNRIFDPAENIEGGVRYLKFLTQLFDNDISLSVAAYNAGENAVQRFHGIPRYTETQNYVRKVLALYSGQTSYVPWNGKRAIVKPRPVVYYKFVDEKGITNYSTTPRTEALVMKLTS